MNALEDRRARQPLRVLLVEDTVNMQIALAELVDAVMHGEVVSVAGSESRAMAWADSHIGGWDLAIVDLTLEDGDGFSIVRRLQQLPHRGAVIVFSGFVTPVIRRHCETLGAQAVFRKTETRELADYLASFAQAPESPGGPSTSPPSPRHAGPAHS